ncbi:hypothetical protein SuUB15_19830 [Streptococcus uberis]
MDKVRNIPDWELQSWENATKCGKKVVVKLFKPLNIPIIKTNIDFFEAMRLTKDFTLMRIGESEHKITFEYDKYIPEEDTQDMLNFLQEQAKREVKEFSSKVNYYALDKRITNLENELKDKDEVKIIIDGHELAKASVEFTDRGIFLKRMRGDI